MPLPPSPPTLSPDSHWRYFGQFRENIPVKWSKGVNVRIFVDDTDDYVILKNDGSVLSVTKAEARALDQDHYAILANVTPTPTGKGANIDLDGAATNESEFMLEHVRGSTFKLAADVIEKFNAGEPFTYWSLSHQTG